MQGYAINLFGKDYYFFTKAGVFSKNKIDDGTKLLIENIEINNRDRILDLGCGYGIMGVIAGSISRGETVFVDTDIRSIRLTKKNIIENNIKNTKVIISDGFSDLTDRFDLILTYPPSHEGEEVIEDFVDGSKNHLTKKGKFYLVTERRLKKYFDRLLNNYFKNIKIIKETNKHILFLCQF